MYIGPLRYKHTYVYDINAPLYIFIILYLNNNSLNISFIECGNWTIYQTVYIVHYIKDSHPMH